MHVIELVREYEKAKAGIVGLSEVNRLGVMVAGLDFNCQPNLLGASDAAGGNGPLPFILVQAALYVYGTLGTSCQLL